MGKLPAHPSGGTFTLEPASEPSTSGRQAPLAMYFPSGYRPDKADSCSWELYFKEGNRPEHCIVGRLPEVDLVGQTRDAASGPVPCRYAVGLLDRATGKLEYSEIEGGRILRIEPRVRSINYQPAGGGAADEPTEMAEAIRQKRRLVEAFGSTKRKKRMNSAQNAAVNVDAVEGAAAVKSMLEGIKEKAAAEGRNREDVMAAVQSSRQLPPHNPAATVPQDAYRLQELIPPLAWNNVDVSRLRKGAITSAFWQGELAESGEVHAYVLSRLVMIPNAGSEAATGLLKAAAYLSALIKLHGMRYDLKQSPEQGGLSALAATHGIQVEVMEAALEQFYESRRLQSGMIQHACSTTAKSLMLLHILVLAILLEGHHMDSSAVEGLKKALQIKPTLLTSAYKELGCVVKSSRRGGTSETTIALLPPVLPPKTLAEYFPAVKLGTPKARR